MGAFGELLKSRWGVNPYHKKSEKEIEDERIEIENLNQYKCDLSLFLNGDISIRKMKYENPYWFSFGEWLDMTKNGSISFWDVVKYKN